MKRSDELKREIEAKRQEVDRLQREEQVDAAHKGAIELKKLVDEYEIEQSLEVSKFENFLAGIKGGTVSPASGKLKISVSNPQLAEPEYHTKFINAFRSQFENSGEYLRESQNPKGGFLLPSEFDKEIISVLESENVMRQICRVISTQSRHLLPIVTQKPQASWVGEGEQIELTSEQFDRLELGAHKLAAAISLTNELLEDSFYDLEQHVTVEFGKALARSEEESFITGDGNGKPTGVLTTISTYSTCYSTAATLTADALIDLQYSLSRPYRKNATWLMSDVTLSQIRKLKDSTGAFIWQQSYSEGEPDRLLGSPIAVSSYMPTTESNKIKVLYGDFTKYIVADRGNRTVKPLRELLALSDMTAFLMLERVDGKLVDKSAIRGLKF